MRSRTRSTAMPAQPAYVRPAARALAIARENFSSWLYFSAWSKGAGRPTPIYREEPARWPTTRLARFFGLRGRSPD
jgi:hypothetical protein